MTVLPEPADHGRSAHSLLRRRAPGYPGWAFARHALCDRPSTAELSDQQKTALGILSRQVIANMELRTNLRELREALATREDGRAFRRRGWRSRPDDRETGIDYRGIKGVAAGTIAIASRSLGRMLAFALV